MTTFLSFTDFESVGCWKDEWSRALPSMEGKHPLLMEPDYKARSNALLKCAEAALDNNFKYFALQNGGQCFSGPAADKTFMEYGIINTCRGL